jgi:hypothetical protein
MFRFDAARALTGAGYYQGPELLLEVAYRDRALDLGGFPKSETLRFPGYDLEAEIRFADDLEVNRPLSDEYFKIEPPPGVSVEDLAAGMPPPPGLSN